MKIILLLAILISVSYAVTSNEFGKCVNSKCKYEPSQHSSKNAFDNCLSTDKSSYCVFLRNNQIADNDDVWSTEFVENLHSCVL